MAKDAFDAIMGGLRDAAAHAKGKPRKGTLVHAIEIPDVKAIRRRLKLSQNAFARKFGLPLASVRNWEQRRRRPEGPALVLLKVIERSPRTVMAALEPSKARLAPGIEKSSVPARGRGGRPRKAANG